MAICFSDNCPKYVECKRAATNNTGLHTPRYYGKPYAGEKPLCGKHNHYKLFKPLEANKNI